MSFAVVRIAKLKGNFNGIGKHIDRSLNGESSSPRNADPERVNQNLHWDKNGKSYTQNEWCEYTKVNYLRKRVNDHIKENYTLKRKIQHNAVRAVEWMFSSDNLKMAEIFSKQETAESWIKDNREFLADIYGGENIVSMHLHFDELTPHLEVVVVPITAKGGISNSSFITPNKLRGLQTKYAERMEKYGMKRGEKGSIKEHKHPKEFNKNKSYERNIN